MTPLDRAKADLSKLLKDLGRAQAQVLMLETQISRVEAYIEMAPIYESEEAQSEAAKARSSGIAATSVRLSTEMIREAGKRIHTRDLLKALADRGVVVGGSNPVANLSGFLSRSDDLNNSRAEGWGLAEWGDESPTDNGAGKVLKAFQEGETRRPTYVPVEDSSLDDEIPF